MNFTKEGAMTPKKILIFGLPGSGKSTLANKLQKKLNAIHLNADQIREEYSDWDFSETGRLRQAERMAKIAATSEAQFVILDFVCPEKRFRDIVNPDISIFMNTISKSRYEDTNKIFEIPDEDEKITYNVKQKESDIIAQQIAKELLTFDWRRPTVQMLGRWQPFHDGHVALFKRAFSKTGQVAIQVRDCQGWNNSNPFEFEYVHKGIVSKLTDHGFQEGKDFIVQLVPNIVNITYGRDVGYKIEEEKFDAKITNISATKIRKQMGIG